ncbi:hypothetical protein [Pseudomonas orientalis]|uniref:hypothetical protein n=1 Tax=Pseudomonas orientalis TaxID=76758 RepID=UPI000F57A671|nr:hypothetical protein [Pseudomonas orientalis]
MVSIARLADYDACKVWPASLWAGAQGNGLLVYGGGEGASRPSVGWGEFIEKPAQWKYNFYDIAVARRAGCLARQGKVFGFVFRSCCMGFELFERLLVCRR